MRRNHCLRCPPSKSPKIFCPASPSPYKEVPISAVGNVTATGLPAQFLFVDLYSGDLGGSPNWPALVQTNDYTGVILKAYEGLQFNDGGWFQKNWPAIKSLGGDRYGSSWFRGAYLFLKFNKPGEDQADAYLQAVTAAGGWDTGDLLPVIDVERGSQQNSNYAASAQQVIDCTTSCANRLRSETGRNIILYGRGAMRDLAIKDRMGCDLVWNPSYTASMVRNGLEAWALEDIALWQYCGDGESYDANLPSEIPNFGKVDISVYIQGSDVPDIDVLKSRLLGTPAENASTNVAPPTDVAASDQQQPGA